MDSSSVNARCLALFPEMRGAFSAAELANSAADGAYILHEDLFMKFVAARQSDELMMRRVAAYVEELATGDQDAANLAEIGLLEHAVSNDLHGVAPHLGPTSRYLLERVLSRFDVDPAPWKRQRP